tara:strand:- start:553 stop:810 length:258 start_codon:yes stop_codon:yes gene_type:complete
MSWESKNNDRFCPNCVSDMVNQIRNKERVYVCRECGVVEQADETQESQVIKTKKDEVIRERQAMDYYDCSEQDIIYHYIQQKDPS